MERIVLDARRWKSGRDIFPDLLPRLGAPAWHGYNLDALWDSVSNGLNDLKPPFAIRVCHASGVPSEVRDYLQKVVKVFDDARKLDLDVSFVLE